MEKTFCDICKKEISQIDRTYFVSYGEKKTGMFGPNRNKTGLICYDCVKSIDKFIQDKKA